MFRIKRPDIYDFLFVFGGIVAIIMFVGVNFYRYIVLPVNDHIFMSFRIYVLELLKDEYKTRYPPPS